MILGLCNAYLLQMLQEPIYIQNPLVELKS